VGTTSVETAREVEETRRRMEEKVNQLTERAPEEVRLMIRELAKRVLFAVITAAAVMLVRKAIETAWEKATGELPPDGKKQRKLAKREAAATKEREQAARES
jgi:hypothetical protein